MLNTENCLDSSDNINEEPIEFELGSHDIHLADDLMAKWNLLNLFNDSLETP
ncbi:3824_t:CDS:1, partial [Funneliformis mosseae]